MRIRKARLEDLPALARLRRATVRAINSADYSEEDIADWLGRPNKERFLKTHPTTVRFVADDNGKLVGFGDFKKEDPENFWGLYVHKDYIGTGIGTKLLKRCEETAKKMGAKKFKIDSTITAKEFYLKRGYTLLRRKKYTTAGGRRVTVFAMEKRL